MTDTKIRSSKKKAKPTPSRPRSNKDIPGSEPAPETTLADVVSATEMKKAVAASKTGTKATRKRDRRAAKRNDGLPLVKCEICGHEARCLTTHLKNAHSMKGAEYKAAYNGAPVFAPDLLENFKNSGKTGAANDWNHFCRLFNWAGEEERKATIKTLEKETGFTLLQVKEGVLDQPVQ